MEKDLEIFFEDFTLDTLHKLSKVVFDLIHKQALAREKGEHPHDLEGLLELQSVLIECHRRRAAGVRDEV